MGTSRQVTLTESWGGGRGGRVGPAPTFPRPGPSSTTTRRPIFSKGRGGRGGTKRGRGSRGRGRGGHSVALTESSAAEGVFEDDEDDLLCEAALR